MTINPLLSNKALLYIAQLYKIFFICMLCIQDHYLDSYTIQIIPLKGSWQRASVDQVLFQYDEHIIVTFTSTAVNSDELFMSKQGSGHPTERPEHVHVGG